jgi:hypothetical protein
MSGVVCVGYNSVMTRQCRYMAECQPPFLLLFQISFIWAYLADCKAHRFRVLLYAYLGPFTRRSHHVWNFGMPTSTLRSRELINVRLRNHIPHLDPKRSNKSFKRLPKSLLSRWHCRSNFLHAGWSDQNHLTESDDFSHSENLYTRHQSLLHSWRADFESYYTIANLLLSNGTQSTLSPETPYQAKHQDSV